MLQRANTAGTRLSDTQHNKILLNRHYFSDVYLASIQLSYDAPLIEGPDEKKEIRISPLTDVRLFQEQVGVSHPTHRLMLKELQESSLESKSLVGFPGARQSTASGKLLWCVIKSSI